MTFEENLSLHIEAEVPAIYIETTEWERLEAVIKRVCERQKKKAQCWNPLTGLGKTASDNGSDNGSDFMSLIDQIHDSADVDWNITVLEHADRYFQESEKDMPIMFAALLKKLRMRKQTHQIIVVASGLHLPDAIRKDFAIMDFPLPDRDDIKKILKSTKDKYKVNNVTMHVDFADEILDAVRGLGTAEIRNAFAKVACKYNKITAEEIEHLVAEKEQIIRKSGYLEFVKTDISMDNVGGLEHLKEWLDIRKTAFGLRARRHGLQAPKGVLLLGIPGTGKSLSAKAVAAVWKMPLLRLDMGRVFGGLVGESEANMRSTIKVAESMEPCVLWIDEIEKGMPAAGVNGERDGGTSARTFGSFLIWMQEKQKEVFIFATANDISRVPPEFLRKGRFDEIFFVDLPDDKTRESIFEIHLKAIDQKYEPTTELIEKTNGYSGAEIESIVNDAHFAAHRENPEKPAINAKNMIEAATSMVPLSTIKKDEITQLRKFAEHRCRPASEGTPPTIPDSGAEVMSLPQENNMFADK